MSTAKHDPSHAHAPRETRRVTTRTIREMKQRGEKVTMITAYDYTFARLFDDAGADLLLVGQHLVDDDGALQRGLEFHFAARRQIFLP